jgi:hypothetical protein
VIVVPAVTAADVGALIVNVLYTSTVSPRIAVPDTLVLVITPALTPVSYTHLRAHETN